MSYLQEASEYLTAALIMVPISRKLRFASVPGNLGAGIVNVFREQDEQLLR